jgi:hypothetical protein
VERPLAIIGVLACLALGILVSGCGSDSTSTSSSTSGAGSTSTSTRSTSSHGGGGSSRSNGKSQSSNGGGSGGGSGGGATNANGAPLGSSTAKKGDNSIQTFGSPAGDADKAAVVAAMRNFLREVVTGQYTRICSGLSAKNRQAFEQFGKLKKLGCAGVLARILPREAASARKALNGTVTHVRIGGGDAFVLFRPAGGGPVNYLVMRLDKGVWKPLSISTGTPLIPGATPTQ